MIRVVIESPYAGDVERNLRYLDACMADCLRRGESPYASHGLYTRKGVLDDTIPAERELGIQAGFAWRDVAEKTVVYVDLGISRGMEYGIQDADRKGRPVEERKLGADWDDRVAPVFRVPDTLTPEQRKQIEDFVTGRGTGPTLVACREKFSTLPETAFGSAPQKGDPVGVDANGKFIRFLDEPRMVVTTDVHYTNSAVVDQVREGQRELNDLGKALWTQVVRARMRSALVAIGLAAAEHSNIEDSEIDALIAAVRDGSDDLTRPSCAECGNTWTCRPTCKLQTRPKPAPPTDEENRIKALRMKGEWP